MTIKGEWIEYPGCLGILFCGKPSYHHEVLNPGFERRVVILFPNEYSQGSDPDWFRVERILKIINPDQIALEPAPTRRDTREYLFTPSYESGWKYTEDEINNVLNIEGMRLTWEKSFLPPELRG